MKKLFLLSILVSSFELLLAQETLQSVTARGAITTNTVTVGSFNSNPVGLPSGSSIKLATPGGNVGIIIVKGNGAGAHSKGGMPI